MICKTINYEDYNGNSRTEDFYFNISKAELTQLYTSVKGGLNAILDQIVKTQDTPRLMEYFKEIIRLAYGEKSADGRQFRKSKEIYENFEQTEAYSVLFMELLSDAEKAADFIKHVLPKDLVEEAEKNNNGALLPFNPG